jgi:uncharacterized membrane protein
MVNWARRWDRSLVMTALVWAMIALYVVFFSFVTVLKHEAFETTAFDLGNMDQAVWNSFHGRFLPFTNWGEEGTRLAYHVDPILILISPLYLIYSDPRALLVFQSVVIALGAWPIYLLARERLGTSLSALVFPLAYLLFPALQAANMFDFHPTTLVAGLLPYAFYFLEKRKYALFLLFSVLILACKEEMALLVVMLGIYALILQRNRRVGVAAIALGVVWFIAAIYVVIPYYNPAGHSPYLGKYSHLGQGPAGILRTAVTNPLAVVRTVVTGEKLVYLRDLFTPVAFLSLFGPQVLFLSLPTLAIILLSGDPQVYALEKFHYAAPVVPVVIISAIYGTSFLADRLAGRWGVSRQSWVSVISSIVLLSTVLYHWDRGFTPVGRNFALPVVTGHDRLAKEFVALVPDGAIVSAQSKLNPHLSQRERIYMFPRVEDAEYVFFDVTADSWPIHPNDQYDLFQSLVNEEDFGVVAAEDGYVLLRRGQSQSAELPNSFYSFARRRDPQIEYPTVVEFSDALRLLGLDMDREEGMTSLSLYWEPLADSDGDYRIYPFFYDGAGRIVEDTTLRPMTTAIWYPTSEWQPGETVWMQTLPWDVGEDFNIGLGVIDGWDWEARGQRLPPRVITSTLRVRLFDQGTAVQLAEVKGGEIITPRRTFSLPATAIPVNVSLDNQMELLGYDMRPTSPSVDDAIHLTLYWRAIADVDVDYTVLAHLIDRGENIVAQHDGQPDEGRYPTSEWLEGEIVEDEHTLVPAAQYGSGEYRLAVGMYHLEGGVRLPAHDQNGVSLPQSRIVLANVEVRE